MNDCKHDGPLEESFDGEYSLCGYCGTKIWLTEDLEGTIHRVTRPPKC